MQLCHSCRWSWQLLNGVVAKRIVMMAKKCRSIADLQEAPHLSAIFVNKLARWKNYKPCMVKKKLPAQNPQQQFQQNIRLILCTHFLTEKLLKNGYRPFGRA